MDFFRWLKIEWDRAAAVLGALTGLVAMILGWVGASGTVLPSEQLPYLASGAVGGLFALGVAATLWLSADLRDEWRKLNEIQEALTRADQTPDDEPTKSTEANGAASRRRNSVRSQAKG